MNNSLESKLELEGVFVHDKKEFEDIPSLYLGRVKTTDLNVATITVSRDVIFDQSKSFFMAIVNFSLNGVISEYARYYCILGGELVWMTDHRIKTNDRGDGWLDGYLEGQYQGCKDEFFADIELFLKEWLEPIEDESSKK